MTTTAIFIEILVIGLQGIVWLLFLFLLITGLPLKYQPVVDQLKDLKEWAALITLFVLGLAYVLGIIIDRVGDSLLSYVVKRLKIGKKKRKAFRKELEGTLSQEFGQERPKLALYSEEGMMRLQVMSKSAEMNKFLEYVRSRMRIARSTGLNILLITLTGSILLQRNSGDYRMAYLLMGAGLVLVITSLYVWDRISWTYHRRLAEAYSLTSCEQKPNQD